MGAQRKPHSLGKRSTEFLSRKQSCVATASPLTPICLTSQPTYEPAWTGSCTAWPEGRDSTLGMAALPARTRPLLPCPSPSSRYVCCWQVAAAAAGGEGRRRAGAAVVLTLCRGCVMLPKHRETLPSCMEAMATGHPRLGMPGVVPAKELPSRSSQPTAAAAARPSAVQRPAYPSRSSLVVCTLCLLCIG